MNKPNNSKEIFFIQSETNPSHGVSAQFSDEEQNYLFCFWSLGFKTNMSIKDKVVYCWKCIIGKPFLDQITLDINGAKKLCVFLNKTNNKLSSDISQALKKKP